LKCAILQPSYIPWRGYFHQIQKADVFVFYDDVQYDADGWRNRNRIKTRNGSIWLTIPVKHKGHLSGGQKICDTQIHWQQPWNQKHWRTIQQAYRKTPFFSRYEDLLSGFYSRRPERLSELTIEFTIALARELGLQRRFLRSSELDIEGGRTERLIKILNHVGAEHYISGPSARSYIDAELMAQAGVSVEYMTYDYRPYEQLYPPFDGNVSIIDVMFMYGPDAGRWIWNSA
jgi:hypothetical protein